MTIVRPVTGEKVTILVRVWNETVSNLTLMALGSSAPEILLSIIEIIGADFKAGTNLGIILQQLYINSRRAWPRHHCRVGCL